MPLPQLLDQPSLLHPKQGEVDQAGGGEAATEPVHNGLLAYSTPEDRSGNCNICSDFVKGHLQECEGRIGFLRMDIKVQPVAKQSRF